MPAPAIKSLLGIKTGPADFGLMPYDPSYMNTASCKSRITFIDGDIGILEYRGYPIDQLAEKASFLETAYLIWYGELPNAAQLADWTAKVNGQPAVPDPSRARSRRYARS